MRRSLYILFFITLTACETTTERTETDTISTTVQATNTDSESQETLPDKIESIEDIRAVYAAVQSKYSAGDLDSSSFTYDCYGEKSGTVSYFSENGRLRLMRHSYHEYSHFSATESYYLHDSVLYFVLYEETSWVFDPDAAGQGGTKDDITESRYYFVDGSLQQCLEKKYTIRSSVKDNPQPADVANKETGCPPAENIRQSYNLLLGYSEQQDSIRCLEDVPQDNQ
ncbi:MAG: hypothetical protein WBB45_19275 [Cyclobacteriaceae bacterium]